MTDKYFLLDELTPSQALHVLAEAAEETEEGDGLGLMDIRVRTFSSEFYGTSTTLFVPDLYAQTRSKKKDQNALNALSTLLETYRGIAEREPRHGELDLEAQPIAQGIGWLLVNSFATPSLSSAGVSANTASPQEDEYLLLARNIDVDRAATIVEELRFQATNTEITIARTETDNSEPLYIFHVLDDQKRRSAFQSAMAGAKFADCTLLIGFTDNESSIFLPKESRPEKASLHYFCRLVRTAPNLFNDEERLASTGGLLAAVDAETVAQTDGDGNGDGNGDGVDQKIQYTFYFLGGLSFLNQIEFAPTTPQHIDIEVHELTDSQEHLQQLRDKIADAEPFVAYRLKLTKGKYREFKQNEYERLSQQQLDIEQHLAYLSSIAADRPTLLCFTPTQLPALADLIRSMPMKDLQSEELLYGFQAVETYHQEGRHYLLKPPYATLKEMDPLPLWQDLDAMAMHFWLDPLWSRYYRGRGNNCLVFVPKGMTLFPSMHSWDPTEMDAYMRDVMSQWYHGHYGVATIPENPIYLFEPSPYAEDKIHISVLNQDNFRPLKTQLGWFNDNLAIMDELNGVDEYIRTLADDMAKRDLAARVEQEAESAVARFQAAAEATSRQVADKTDVLAADVTQGLERILQKTLATTEEIRVLNERLAALQKLHDEMQTTAKETERLIAKDEQAIDELVQFTGNLRQRVESVLADSQQARQEAQERVTAELDAIRQTHATLQAMLATVRGDDVKLVDIQSAETRQTDMPSVEVQRPEIQTNGAKEYEHTGRDHNVSESRRSDG
ncbi:MAG: hypothetical protein AAF702_40685 [Chloroflexota bacterium]